MKNVYICYYCHNSIYVSGRTMCKLELTRLPIVATSQPYNELCKNYKKRSYYKERSYGKRV